MACCSSVQYCTVLCSEVALFRKPFGIGHMYIYNFLLRMADTMTFQNINLSFGDTLYIWSVRLVGQSIKGCDFYEMWISLPRSKDSVSFLKQIREDSGPTIVATLKSEERSELHHICAECEACPALLLLRCRSPPSGGSATTPLTYR
jgi:hypothetical protein